jgi:RNA polymerase-binding transcription factor DksA
MSDIHTYEARLKEMIDAITKELQAVGVHNPENPSDWTATQKDPDDDDADDNLTADTIEEWNERESLVETLEPTYNDIVRALEKITTGKFGACEICGVKIEEKRLDAIPSARTCITHIDEPLT